MCCPREPSCQTQSKSELEDVETTGSPQKSGEFQREPEGDAKASTESCASHVKINASSNLQSQASKDEDQQEEEIKVSACETRRAYTWFS